MTDAVEDPLARLRAAGATIVAGVERMGPAWVVAQVDRILDAWGRVSETDREAIRIRAATAGRDGADRVAAALRQLFASDPADQVVTPLQVVRTLTREPTALLSQLGVPDVVRDPFDERTNPDDRYDLAPRTLGDLDDALAPELLVWGMAKARVLRDRAESGGTEAQ